MTDAVNLEHLAAEVARVHARLDAQAEADLRVMALLAAPPTPEERRAGFVLVPGTAGRRTPRRGRLRAVAG
jgi:hypothetical protein